MAKKQAQIVLDETIIFSTVITVEVDSERELDCLAMMLDSALDPNDKTANTCDNKKEFTCDDDIVCYIEDHLNTSVVDYATDTEGTREFQVIDYHMGEGEV
jgi:hypothetical protein